MYRYLLLMSLAAGLGRAEAQNLEDLLRRSESGREAEPAQAVVVSTAPGGEQVIRGRNTVTASSPTSTSTPTPTPTPTPTSPSQIWRIDPTSPILKSEQTEGTPFEPTSLFVSRTLVAVEQSPELPQTPKWTSSIPISVPVIYRSRSLVWSQEDFAQARKITQEVKELLAQSRDLPAKFEALAKRWNALVEKGTPGAVLMADSPSLPSNQGDLEALRGKPLPGFDAGSGIRFEIKAVKPSH